MDYTETNKQNMYVPEDSNIKTVRKRNLDSRNETTSLIGQEKLFAFWGSSTNLGKRTLAQSYAMQIAKMGYKVLYVEFDYLVPTLAVTTALTNPDKNFYQLALSQDTFDLNQFIANKMDVSITKEMAPLFDEIPMDFNFLGLPAGFDEMMFPTITNDDFLKSLLSALKDSEFEAVIINLPNNIENLFSYPVMLESDVIFSVTTPNPIRTLEYRKIRKILDETPLDMNKWEVLVNQVGSEISKQVCDDLLHEQSLLTIPYDIQRPAHELDLMFGSPIINKKMAELAAMYGFEHPEPQLIKKKGFFRRR